MGYRYRDAASVYVCRHLCAMRRYKTAYLLSEMAWSVFDNGDTGQTPGLFWGMSELAYRVGAESRHSRDDLRRELNDLAAWGIIARSRQPPPNQHRWAWRLLIEDWPFLLPDEWVT